jgi:hypothetical protein
MPILCEVRNGSNATKLNCLRHVRSTPNSYQIADITVRQLRANRRHVENAQGDLCAHVK